MIKIKHFMETREDDDGDRLWVESVGLTKDLAFRKARERAHESHARRIACRRLSQASQSLCVMVLARANCAKND